MWWLLIVIAVAVIGLMVVILGFVPPPNAKVVIKIRNGQLVVTRGQLHTQPREFVAEILQQARVTRGFIAVAHSRRAAFSRNIPRVIQQRLRNVLLND
jgi:hypothetical protein